MARDKNRSSSIQGGYLFFRREETREWLEDYLSSFASIRDTCGTSSLEMKLKNAHFKQTARERSEK